MPPFEAQIPQGGLLIAVEGCDGSGKSTQIGLLYRHLRRKGLPVHLTSWNSSPSVHPLQRQAKRERILTPRTYALLNASDFADRYEREIAPRLRLRQIVLCDRYVGTAYARDEARGLDRTWIARLYDFARTPDLTLFFHAPPEVAAARLVANRHGIGYYEAGLDLGLSEDPLESFRIFQGRVLRCYEQDEGPLGYVRIDATRRLRVQQREVRRIVGRLVFGGDAQ
jgi:dTMP kinase